MARMTRGLAAIAACVALSLVGACSNEGEPAAGEQSATAAPVVDASPVEVVYKVDGVGTDRASLTAKMPTGTEQAANAELPLRSEKPEQPGVYQPGVYLTMQAGDFAYISAQNVKANGRVTCQIIVDGSVISENTASGGYAIATCEGTV